MASLLISKSLSTFTSCYSRFDVLPFFRFSGLDAAKAAHLEQRASEAAAEAAAHKEQLAKMKDRADKLSARVRASELWSLSCDRADSCLVSVRCSVWQSAVHSGQGGGQGQDGGGRARKLSDRDFVRPLHRMSLTPGFLDSSRL